MSEVLDLVGIGIGPFNLSLAALLDRVESGRSRFFERKGGFDWHAEVMFPDSVMQTSYLKDLVTPVDPTSPYSFLNYLVDRKLFYAFLNTQRGVVSRREFEQYCQWVAAKLERRLRFGIDVRAVDFDGSEFRVETSGGVQRAKHICVATGYAPRIPDVARPHLGPRVFHAKSPELAKLRLDGRRVLVVGGGQTGIEVFRNALLDRWGRAADVQLVTRRSGLEPLDESAFTNEYFTPHYLDGFWGLASVAKAQVVASQKLASDGNTPAYLLDLYNDLYRLKLVEGDPRGLGILANRRLRAFDREGEAYRVRFDHAHGGDEETIVADVVILATGFEARLPPVLEPLFPRLKLDGQGRFRFRKSYAVEWDGPDENRIYALNYSRHEHGIADPQTSLMAWRAAVVVNDLMGRKVYDTDSPRQNFVEHAPRFAPKETP